MVFRKIRKKVKRSMQGLAFGIIEGIIMIFGITLGISALDASKILILVAGLTAGIADAFANSAGFFVSEEVEAEHKIGSHSKKEILFSTLLCGLATFIAAIFPALPYLFLSIGAGRLVSIVVSLSLLFMFGVYHAKISGENPIREGLKFAIIGAVAGVICFGIGKAVPLLFNL